MLVCVCVYIYTYPTTPLHSLGCPHGVMVKVLACGIIESEFKLLSLY